MPPAADEARLVTLSHLALRNFIGVLGVFLPALLVVGSLMFVRETYVWGGSISAHYHAPHLRDIFVGGLFAIGVFLCFYQGYPRHPDDHYPLKGRSRLADWAYHNITDAQVTTVAGIAAIATALIPVPDPALPDPGMTLAKLVHWVSAAAFLGLLAFLSIFHFTRSNLPPDDWSAQDRRERRIYLACGAVMLGALALIPVSVLTGLGAHPAPGAFGAVFWLEAIAIWAFGLSWLIKGKSLDRILGI